jgi:hypothetical protein
LAQEPGDQLRVLAFASSHEIATAGAPQPYGRRFHGDLRTENPWRVSCF